MTKPWNVERCAGGCGEYFTPEELANEHERCGWCGECPDVHSDEACALDFHRACLELRAEIETEIALDTAPMDGVEH